MHEWIMIGIGLVLTVGTDLFVASEFALVNLDRNDLEARAARGEKRLGPTIKALKITSRQHELNKKSALPTTACGE